MRECPACRRCFADEINHCPDDGEGTVHSITGEPVLDSRYQLERRLGQGGMGVVFQARHIFLKTSHAIKVILPDLVGNDPMLVTRFRQEALAAAAIRHQNIIAVTDFGVVRGLMPFLVMEFVKGCSLQDVLAAEGRLAPERALEIISAVGAGVGAAHKQNIVHRDLKPLNIMIQDDVPVSEGIKVLDFGLAKIKSGELLGSFVQAKTSGLMGSPFYMAPEQWSDEEPDVRADIYSLGVILYQMLAGDVPFRGSSIPSIMKKHLTNEAPPFASFELNVPQRIEEVVRHALAKDAALRPQTVGDFVLEFREAVTASTAVRMNVGAVQGVPARETGISLASPSGSFPSPGTYDTTVHFHTDPPFSRVFVNNVSVGITNNDGLLVLGEMHRGEHQVVVLHEGFEDWRRKVELAGGEFHLEVRLQSIAESSQLSGTVSGTISASSLSDSAFTLNLKEDTGKRRLDAAREEAQREEVERLKREDEARLIAQAEAKRLEELQAQEEVARKQAAEDAQRKALADAVRRAEEERIRVENESRQRAEAEALLAAQQQAENAGLELQRLSQDSFNNSQGRLDSIGTAEAPQNFSVMNSLSQATSGPSQETALINGDTGRPGNGDTGRPGEPVNVYNFGSSSGALAHELSHASSEAASTITAPTQSSLPKYIIAAIVVVLLMLGGATYFVVSRVKGDVNQTLPQGNPTSKNNVAKKSVVDMVAIPGGTFMMGRDKGLPQESPAHKVTVAPFQMDRTEVTNADYASFIAETGNEAPAGWVNNQPPPGQEQWPVASVSIDDVNAYAAWRSKRDGVLYRPPTEEEWEFAARSGSDSNNYPWGTSWDPKYANLGTKVIKPVGSVSEGKNSWGNVDLIGNVWEWTSTKIFLYPGNPNVVPPEQREWIVIRGGSFSSEATGDKAVSAVTRQWVEASRKDALLGFRLVHPVS